MSKSATVHAKVLRSHPDISAHPGESIELSREKFDHYAEKGAFFGEITAKEAKQADSATETATAPEAAERAVAPVVAPAVVAETTETRAKAPKTAEKAPKVDAKAPKTVE